MSLRYLVQCKYSKLAPIAVTERQIMLARTEDNVTVFDKVLLSKKSYNFTVQHAKYTVCCHTDPLFTANWFEQSGSLKI